MTMQTDNAGPSGDDAGGDTAPLQPASVADGSGAPVEDYDADALVQRLKRNAGIAMCAVALLVAVLWREPMAVVGSALGGGVVLLNFLFLESLVGRLRGGLNPAPNPLQMAFLAFRVVLMGLMLYGIFALPGVRPIPVALGLSILVLAVVIESLSEAFSAPSPPA